MAKGDMSIRNKIIYSLVGTVSCCSVLVLLYFYFPSGFRAAVIGIPLFLYSHFYSTVAQPPVAPLEASTERAEAQQADISSAPVKAVADTSAKNSGVAVQAEVEAPVVAPTNDHPAEARNFSPGARAMAAAMKSRAGQKTSGAKGKWSTDSSGVCRPANTWG